MKNKLKKIYWIFLITLISFIPKAYALDYSEQEDYYDYTINKYDINVVVNENNTFNITENITAYFNVPKHGIYRTIPLKNEINRLDGTTTKNRAKVTHISVDNEYSKSRENNNYKLKIGSADETLTGEQSYKIKYTYNIGKDPLEESDELYYNIIGPEWDTIIKYITFKITMPKEFDSSKLGFSSGIVGSTENDNVIYSVDGNVITGSYIGTLDSGNALTIRMELPEGYFVGAGFKTSSIIYAMFGVPLLCLLISFFLWRKYGKDDTVIETVEFYPPEGFNSLEIGFLYKGKASNEDVVSLLIYLANKGYIKITEIEKKKLFSKSKGFKITKLKDYDGNNTNEQLFLAGLFKTNPNEVTDDFLYNRFYVTMNRILTNTNKRENKRKIFESAANSKKKYVILMIIATYCIITIPPIVDYGQIESSIFALLFPAIGFTVMISMLFGDQQTVYINGKPSVSSIVPKVFGIVWGSGFGGIPWLIFLLPVLLQDSLYLISYIVGLACVAGMIICYKYLPKRTPYGNEILGKIKGFKNFLETAEKDKLETMVLKNPSYFYNILPYTYVLGVSDKWIKNFESISMQAPSWYDSSSDFNVVTFGSFMNSTMSSAQSVMASSPSSSGSSGGSSGGGSSGGGSGGGGGGSW